jgi:large subunit ribosomal protein L4e
MKVKIQSLDGSEKGTTELPPVFDTPIRGDVIRRAVVSAQSARYQPKAPYDLAGEQTSAESVGKGRGMARMRRTKSGRHVGAFVAQAVGGHKVHGPKIEKKIHKKMNKKERMLAIRSAIAATASPELVAGRGHRINGLEIPIVVPEDFQKISKTSEVRDALLQFGLGDEMDRLVNGRKQRAGKGKSRGRRTRTPKGPLFVVEPFSPVENALSNLPGIDVVRIDSLNAEVLAPGGVPGRLSVWTVPALERAGEIYR